MNAQEYAKNLMKHHKHALQMRQENGRIDLRCSCGWTYSSKSYGNAKVTGDQHLFDNP